MSNLKKYKYIGVNDCTRLIFDKRVINLQTISDKEVEKLLSNNENWGIYFGKVEEPKPEKKPSKTKRVK
jgi:hypothetical protein